MQQSIFLIDDDQEIISIIIAALAPLNVTVDSSKTSQEALKKVRNNRFSLIIIDITLPDGSGFELFKEIREIEHHKNTPIFFLTGNEVVESKVNAFSLGADDYIVKPFHLLELRARVARSLRKHNYEGIEGDQIIAGPLILELSAQRLKMQGKNEPIALTPREFKILLLLVKNPNQVLSREHILKTIWGTDVYVTDRTIDAHVCYIRKKLGDYSVFIQSIPGEGYRFNNGLTT